MSAHAEIIFPPFRLDIRNEQLWRDRKLIALRPKTFAILRYLAEHSGRLVTKDELLRAVWGETQVSEEGLRDYLREIRQALGDDATTPQFVETVRGRGYRFFPVTAIHPVQSAKFQVPSSSSSLIPSPQRPAPTLVGREAELVQLHQRLAKAAEGVRQLVFVTGEPGIGKTAIVEAFLSGLGQQGTGNGDQENQKVKGEEPSPTPNPQHPIPGAWLGWGQCIEQHGAGEAFLPVLDALGRLCRGTDGEDIIDVLRRHAPMWLVQLPAFIEPDELEMLQRKVQGVSRGRMLREFAEMVEALANVGAIHESPLLVLVLEDLHWSDVSTLDLLAFLARRKEPARLLIVGTYRPVEMIGNGHPLKGIVQELYAHGLAVEVAVGALSEAEIGEYLQVRCGGGAIHESPLRRLTQPLHHHTGGNPLFLVSLVDDLVTRGLLAQDGKGWALQGEVEMIGIPETIRHLVARQRERLPLEEQRVLEAASVAGMEFSAAAVAAALATDTALVERRCEQLAGCRQFLERLGVEEWPDGTLAARYGFLHALYQQLWHEWVSPTQLQHHHLRIGERKERGYGERTREIAAELAVHFEQGQDYRRAVRYLEQAAKNALRRSAHQDASTLLRKGLELLKNVSDPLERTQHELALRLTLGTSLAAIQGWGDPAVKDSYSRSRALCQEFGDSLQLFSVLWGLRAFYVVRAELDTAHELAEHLLVLAQNARDAALLLEAHLGLGVVLLYQGDVLPARQHLEQAMTFHDPQNHHAHALLYGQDPAVDCLAHSCPLLFGLGFVDLAVEKSRHALALAEQIAHPLSQLRARCFTAATHQGRGEARLTQQHAETALKIASEHGFAYFAAMATMLRGWAIAEQGEVEEGLAQIRQGLSAHSSMGAELGRPYYLSLLAEACQRAGRVEEGLAALDEALLKVNTNGERHYEAELYRLKGELLSNAAQKDHRREESPLVEACFQQALTIARQQGTKMFELRATLRLVQLWRQQRKKTEARQLLTGIYSWFTEGFDLADLQEAKALLDKLDSK
ncbi:MAG: AAA family ATPase [Deltaproteobacteria bacterium]|nr:AAA family ATPase [Deltaproteobacteria bacterium]